MKHQAISAETMCQNTPYTDSLPTVDHLVICKITLDNGTVKTGRFVYKSADPLSAIQEINRMSPEEFGRKCSFFEWLK